MTRIGGDGARGLSLLLLLLLLLALAPRGPAQTLAHKGWAGAGVTVEPWWEHGIFYQLDPLSFYDFAGNGSGDLQRIINRLDALQALGVDAIVLSPLSLRPRKDGEPEYDAVGEEAFDQWVSEAGQRKIRVIVDLLAGGGQPLGTTLNLARFWLSRGVAGFRLVHPEAEVPVAQLDAGAEIRELRRVMEGYPGERVLISDLGSPLAEYHDAIPHAPVTQTNSRSRALPDLSIVRAFQGWGRGELRAESIRKALRNSISSKAPQALLMSVAEDATTVEGRAHATNDQAKAKVLATVLLLTPAGALLSSGQEIGPTVRSDALAAEMEDEDQLSVLNWYRKMSLLHHASPAVRSGAMRVLATGNASVVAWVRLAGSPASGPVLVAMNVSDRPVSASFAAELAKMGVAPGLLRTLAQSGDELPASLNEVELGPYGILVCEIQKSDRSAPAAARRTHPQQR